MRVLLMAGMAALVIACSTTKSATGPVTPPDTTKTDTSKLKDPTVLVRNHTPERAYFYWQSGTTIFGADTIQAGVTRCEAFSAVADSAFWLLATDTTTAGWAQSQSNYFDPTTRPAWTADINGDGHVNPGVLAKDTTAECVP